MSRVHTLIATAVATLLLTAAVAVPAQAGSTRVSISDFQWSKNPQVDLGESVTWDWIGPDTQHSISGVTQNALQWDSDPGGVLPHPLGDTFTVAFDQPGVYTFQCKLHNSVRGTVTVSDIPGDPNSDPGPQPSLNFDLIPPNLTGPYLTHTRLGPRGRGAGLRFGIDERGTVTADYYRLIRVGKGRRARWISRFAGFDEWSTHVGNNDLRFARRAQTFQAGPGRYYSNVYATDEASNSTPTFRMKFVIVAPRRR
jgi:plastocyanin